MSYAGLLGGLAAGWCGPWPALGSAPPAPPPPDPEPPEGDPIDVVDLPEIQSILVLGNQIAVYGGSYTGTYDSVEVRLQQTASLETPGDIYVDWTDAPAVDGSATEGQSCYIAARVIAGGAVALTVINPLNYGPWQAFSEVFVFQSDFRGDYPGVGITHEPNALIVHPGNIASYPNLSGVPQGNPALTRPNCGGAGTPANRASNGTSGFAGRINGRMPMTTALVHFAVELPAGWYRLRPIAGDPAGGAQTSLRLEVRNGPLKSSPLLAAWTQPVSTGGLGVAGQDVPINTIKTWDPNDPASGVWSEPFYISGGAVSLWREGSALGGPGLVCLDIKNSLPG